MRAKIVRLETPLGLVLLHLDWQTRRRVTFRDLHLVYQSYQIVIIIVELLLDKHQWRLPHWPTKRVRNFFTEGAKNIFNFFGHFYALLLNVVHCHVVWKSPKLSQLDFQFKHFPPFCIILKLTSLVTLFDRKL